MPTQLSKFCQRLLGVDKPFATDFGARHAVKSKILLVIGRSWFDIRLEAYPGEEPYWSIESGDHGEPTEGKASDIDRREGQRIEAALKAAFPRGQVKLQVIDESVCVTLYAQAAG